MQLSDDPATRQQQLTSIRTFVNANYVVNGSGVFDQTTADAMNAIASPDYWIFRNNVSAKEVSDAISAADMVSITASDSDRILKLFNLRSFDGGAFHGNIANDRTAFNNVFSAAAGTTSRLAVAALWAKHATVAEKLLSLSGVSAGGGNGSTAALAAVTGDGAEGTITVSILEQAASLG